MTEVEKLLKTIDERGYTHIIFDLDATLTLLNLPWREWVDLIAQRLPPDQADSFRRITEDDGSSWQQIANEHVERYETFLPALIEASEEFESMYFAHTPYDELVRAVHELAEQGKVMYAWSANMRSTIERALLELGIRHHFNKLVTREDVRLAKPHPEGWMLLDDSTPREQFLFVGDSSNDAGAAQSLGIDFFEITYFKQGQ
ncbi:HAD family hydrolase [Candidatus Saccharibacteria bacterium]|nr:MAG: HAD family hydrolase [Candidatus Saccharibacteria bacterium]